MRSSPTEQLSPSASLALASRGQEQGGFTEPEAEWWGKTAVADPPKGRLMGPEVPGRPAGDDVLPAASHGTKAEPSRSPP